ncbi:MAG: hypothetical protein PHP69_03345 [Candidatus Omnitrophica bacterium]|nr:hypothetical protein [Candidatus Omnitrophota bacterium]
MKKTGNHNINISRSRERSVSGKTTKCKWQKLEISKIKLNPEQAALSCCNALDRGAQWTTTTTQCRADESGCEYAGFSSSS